jgi:uncharacterized membrane protein
MDKNPTLQGIVPAIYNGLKTNQVDQITAATYVILLLTFGFWALRMLSLLAAFFVYIPLLCEIRGNLKEYCVHKIDKRYIQLTPVLVNS